MTWCNNMNDNNNNNNNRCTSESNININCSNYINIPSSEKSPCSSLNNDEGLIVGSNFNKPLHTVSCPSCGQHFPLHHHQASGFNDLPGLPAGVKFDPTDPEVLGHLEGKVKSDLGKLHPLLDQFIPTIEGENGICYTHPDKLPGVRKDGVMRHFFHCPSKAYTTGTRKRRKVHTDENGGETRWHKTGKTRPILVNGAVKGFKKILVLYSNYRKQRKAEKTNWVMHQYHIGDNEEERDGEYVLSKVFYQTQPRQCGSNMKELIEERYPNTPVLNFNQSQYLPYDHGVAIRFISEENASDQLIPNLALQGDGSLFVQHSGASN